MIGSKVYFQPRDYILGAIHDIKETQKGRGTSFDIEKGKISFVVDLYSQECEFLFTVADIGKNRCKVDIGILGDVKNREEKIIREYTFLDSMIAANTQIEFINCDKGAH